MCAGALAAPKRESDPLELEAIVSCPAWVLETELGPLKEQHTLLTPEASLQPPPRALLIMINEVGKVDGWHTSPWNKVVIVNFEEFLKIISYFHT